MTARSEREYVPTILMGMDGDPPTFVNVMVAETALAAVAYARANGELADDGEEYEAEKVLMRELDPIACKIRGVDEGWWVECTPRAKRTQTFWKIDG